MKRLLPLLGLLLLVFAQAQVTRSYTSRYQTNTTGNIALIGNTLMTCSPSGRNGSACANARDGTGNNNSFTMVYVDVDTDPNTFNSSSADLALPSGATVLWAGLYWMSTAPSSGVPNPNTVLFRTPTMTTYTSLTAIQTDSANTGSGPLYQGIAEVTDLVRAGGNGTYWVANVQGRENISNIAAGWSLVVVYQHPAEPLRHLNVFDGWANVSGNTTVTTTVSGFLTPATGPVTVYLGVVALEGDMVLSGDRLRLNNSDVSNVLNPSNNFFNSTISDLGEHVTSKNPNYKNQLGFDIDRVKPDNALPNNATSAKVDFVTNGDAYSPGVLTFAVNIFAPDLTTEFRKSVVDLNGGKVLPGDILEYKVTLKNTGMDGATNVLLTDPIPSGTQYVPGSLQVVSNATGAPTGSFTDATGDDIAEYVSSCPEHGGRPCVRFRLGTGANASQGGLIPPQERAEVRFRVQILPSASGQTVTNTAYISYNAQTLGTSYSRTAQAKADVAIPYPPGLSKAFSPATINPRDTSTLTLTLTNPNPCEATLTADLVDTLPAGLAVADPPGTSTTCPEGTVAANPGGNTLTLSAGAKIPAQGSCTVTVKVTALEPGDYTNTLPVGALETDLGSNPEEATATLSVVGVVGFTLSGTVYHDLEPNGLRGPEEDWSTGTTVYVNLVQGNTVVQTATVDPGTGTFSFQGVAPGDYSLVVTTTNTATTPQAPSGWLFINPGDGKRQITVAGHLQGLDFGLFHGGVVQGRVFLDDGLGGGNPNDALQNGGEKGVGNVAVTATDGTRTRTAFTDGHGLYRIYIPASWGEVTLSHPLRPATGWNDGSTPAQVADWDQATSPTSLGATLGLGPATGLAGYSWVRNFGVVRDSRFYPDASGQTSSPGVYTFSHWYRPGTLGTVTLYPLAPSPRYTYQVRVDLDCDGTFGPGEDWTPFPYTFPVSGTWPREGDDSLKACAVEVRALVPPGEPLGAMDMALLEARLVWAGNTGVVEKDSLTDTLQVTGGEVRLEKRVRNVSQNTPFGSTGSGKPGEVLEYCIAYRNLGTEPVSSFTLSDPVPFFTDPLTSVADYGNRAIKWTHGSTTHYLTAQSGDDAGEIQGGLVRVEVGSVGSGEMGEVCYQVRVR